MTATTRGAALRLRAHRLRELATAIETMPAMSLDTHAGEETWQGQRPMLCRTLLSTNQHQLHGAADDLRVHALRLERDAEELDAAARLGIAG